MAGVINATGLEVVVRRMLSTQHEDLEFLRNACSSQDAKLESIGSFGCFGRIERLTHALNQAEERRHGRESAEHLVYLVEAAHQFCDGDGRWGG